MDKVPNITRRAALLGMGAVTITGIAKAEAAVAAVTRSGAADVDAQLSELSRRYIEAAKIIDPSISGAWLGTDPNYRLRPGPVVMSVYFERKGGVIARGPSKYAPTRVERAIKAHKRTWDRFTNSCDGADELHPGYRGAEGVAAWERANRAEERALMRLLRLPALGQDGAKRAAYLYDAARRGRIDLTTAQVLALLRSASGVM